ncbi:MAG: motility-associated protein, partial [Acetobacteraceae bacterium]
MLICVFGTFVVEGGSIHALMEALPFELIIIGGGALGSFVMANSIHDAKHAAGGVLKALKGAAFRKSDYVDL